MLAYGFFRCLWWSWRCYNAIRPGQNGLDRGTACSAHHRSGANLSDYRTMERHRFKKAADKIGLGMVPSFHAFRRSHVSVMDDIPGGVPLIDKMAQLGHSHGSAGKASMTMLYTRSDLSRRRVFVEKLAKLVMPYDRLPVQANGRHQGHQEGVEESLPVTRPALDDPTATWSRWTDMWPEARPYVL